MAIASTGIDKIEVENTPTVTASSIGAQPLIDFSGKNVIHVSKGSASSDSRDGYSKYDESHPFLTPFAAAAAAVDGDLIYVHTGIYNVPDSIIPPTNVTWYFELGSIINGTGGEWHPCFFRDDLTNGQRIEILGFGKFYNFEAAVAQFVAVSGTPVIIFEGISASVTTATTNECFYLEGCLSYINFSESISSAGYDAIWLENPKNGSIISCPELVGFDNGFESQSNDPNISVFVNSSRIHSIGTSDPTHSAVHISGSGKYFINASDIHSISAEAVEITLGDPEITIIGSRIRTDLADSGAIIFGGDTKVENCVMNLIGCSVEVESSSVESIVGMWAVNTTINIRGTTLNKPIGEGFITKGCYIDNDGALVALQGIILPTSDPHILGAVWNNIGILTTSSG